MTYRSASRNPEAVSDERALRSPNPQSAICNPQSEEALPLAEDPLADEEEGEQDQGEGSVPELVLHPAAHFLAAVGDQRREAGHFAPEQVFPPAQGRQPS